MTNNKSNVTIDNGPSPEKLCLHEGAGRVHTWAGVTYDAVTDVAYVPFQIWPDTGEYHNFCRPFDISEQAVASVGNIWIGNAHARDGHNQCNLAIDASGYLHAAYGAHNSPVFYRRSVEAHDRTLAGGFLSERELPFKAHTYPRILCHPEDPNEIVILCRRGPAWDTPDAGISMIRSTDGGCEWEGPIEVIRDIKGAGYFGAAIDHYGHIHIAFTPRHSDARTNEDRAKVTWGPLYYLKSPDMGRTWETEDGQMLGNEAIPARERLTPVVSGDQITSINGNVAYDSRGFPLIVYADYSDPANAHAFCAQLKLVRWNGKNWLFHAITPSPRVNGFSITCDKNDILRVYGVLDNPFAKHPETNVELYISSDLGVSWQRVPALKSSEKTVTYVVGQSRDIASRNVAAWTVGASPDKVDRIYMGPTRTDAKDRNI